MSRRETRWKQTALLPEEHLVPTCLISIGCTPHRRQHNKYCNTLRWEVNSEVASIFCVPVFLLRQNMTRIFDFSCTRSHLPVVLLFITYLFAFGCTDGWCKEQAVRQHFFSVCNDGDVWKQLLVLWGIRLSVKYNLPKSPQRLKFYRHECIKVGLHYWLFLVQINLPNIFSINLLEL